MDRLADIDKLFEHLKKDAPRQTTAYMEMGNRIKKMGVIDDKNRSLILVALAVSIQCDHCIAWNIKVAKENGASREEIIDAGLTAVMMGGSPKMMYMTVLYEELEKQFPEE